VTVFSSKDNYRHAVVGPGVGNVWEIYFNPKRAKVRMGWLKPIAAIAQIVSGMRALVWTELATDHSKHARLPVLRIIALARLRKGGNWRVLYKPVNL